MFQRRIKKPQQEDSKYASIFPSKTVYILNRFRLSRWKAFSNNKSGGSEINTMSHKQLDSALEIQIKENYCLHIL